MSGVLWVTMVSVLVAGGAIVGGGATLAGAVGGAGEAEGVDLVKVRGEWMIDLVVFVLIQRRAS